LDVFEVKRSSCAGCSVGADFGIYGEAILWGLLMNVGVIRRLGEVGARL
jgi:hypothetical protein